MKLKIHYITIFIWIEIFGYKVSTILLVIRSVSDGLRAQSTCRFVKFVCGGGGGGGRRPNPLHILQTYFGSEVRQ